MTASTSPLGAVLLLFWAVLFSALSSQGQVVTASLYGTVTDQTGAAVPEASVTATNVATGIAAKTKADATGNYVLPSLAPGNYTLAVEKAGFKSTVLSRITLLVDQQAVVNAQLQVGNVSTTVEVSGGAPLVDTITASVGTVVGEREVVELPLNVRRLTALATLVPGTVDTRGQGYAQTQAGGSPFSEATYVAGGGRDASNTLLIDGVESRVWSTGAFGVEPPPDATQEFKIQTNIYDAAFGKTAGSTMNLITKSGTNELHGDAYEFLRNDKLDARNFFATDQTDPVTGQDIPGSARPEYRRNQFGVSLGGPIHKNKTFAFGYYDALRQVQGGSLTNQVPTDVEKTGDLSAFLTKTTANLCAASGTAAPPNLAYDTGQLFYPASLSNFTCPANPAVSGSTPYTILVGNPIPNNMITSIDPVGLKVVAGFPEPNRPGFPNYVNQTPKRRSDNQFGVRIDHSFGDKDQFFGRYLFGQANISDPGAGYTSLPGFGDTIFFRGQNVSTSWVHTFGPHLLNEAHVGFQRNNPVENCQACPRAPGFVEGFGIKNLRSLAPSLEGFPFFSFNNFAGVGDAGYRPVTNVEMLEQYGDSVTWTHGRQTIRVGADLQWWQDLRQQNPFSPHGQFTYNGQYSSLAGEVPSAGGISDLADLELGYPNSGGSMLGYADVNQVGGTFSHFYGQDDIKLTPNLSLNLGLRWEFRRPPLDKRNNIVQFIPLRPAFSGPGNGILVTAVDDAQNDAYCTSPAYSYLISASGQCLVANSALRRQLGFTGRTRRTVDRPNYRDYAPRLGVTWRPLSSDRLIVRTGYGIFYDIGNLNILQFVSGNPIFSPKPYYNPGSGPPPLTNGVPTTIENVFASPNIPPLSQQYAALWVPPDFQPPRVQMWSFGVESQVAQNWALEVNYIGTKANHLDNGHIFFNQPEPGLGSNLQPRRPYPDFNIMAFFTSDNNSVYHSLQAKLTKRLSNGLTFLTAYTFGKGINNGEGNESGGSVPAQYPQDDNNQRANRARSMDDSRHRLAFSSVWQLPVGNGKRFLNQSGPLNGVLGGWELSGIWAVQSGFPFGPTSAQDYSNTNSQTARPDRTCTGVGKKTVNSWFDASCFTTAALQALLNTNPRFGNSGRNILEGPGLNNVDFALIKNFQLGERFKLEFRAEAYNIFNQAHFSNPNFTCGTTSTGTCAPNPLVDIGNNIGKISGAGSPRDIQFGLKVLF